MTKRAGGLTQTRVIIGIALIVTLLWGSAYPCVKLGYEWFGIAAEDIPSKVLIAGIRFFAAGMMTLLFGGVKQKRIPVPARKNWMGILALSLVLTVLHYIFFYIGLGNTTGVKGAIVYATSTFFAVLAAHFFYRNDRLNLKKAIGCILGFAGIVTVNLGTGGFDGGFSFLGEGSMLIAAVAFAVGNLQSKQLSGREEPVTVTGYQLLIGGAILTAAGILSGGHFSEVSVKGIALLTYMAFLSAVSFTLWTALLKVNPMGKVSVYNFLVPIFGVILSGVILGETFLTVRSCIALVCVCAGIYLCNKGREVRREETNHA